MTDTRNRRVGFWLGDVSLEYGGIGPYALRILHSLLASHEPGWKFILLCDEGSCGHVRSILDNSLHRLAHLETIPRPPSNENSRHEFFQRFSFRRVSDKSHPIAYRSQRYLGQWLEGLNLDLIHFPAQTPPFPAEQHIPYIAPPLLNVRTPFIATVHDVQELRFPEYFSPAQRAIRAMHRWETLDRAGKIIVSFDHVKVDLIKFFNLPEEKIHVCPIPFDSISLEEPSPAAREKYRARYASWMPYLLYAAQTWRHKNHALLIRALGRLHEQGHVPPLRLVCTGAKNDYYQTIEAQIEQLKLRDFVLFTDVVPEDELKWLYEQAAAVVIPTEYEAGSFPLFEAIKYGAPVICSDVTSLPDTIGGDHRFLFDPYDTQRLAELIVRITSDSSFREANIANSAKQANRLQSINAAPYFYEAYRSLLQTL
jgi:glycosyltransferase involved in cell wall biosynthesis